MKMIVKKKQSLTVLRDCLVCKIEQKREKKRSLLGSSAGARSLAYRYQKTLRITHYALRITLLRIFFAPCIAEARHSKV